MQNLITMDMIVIEEYYHITIMNKNINWMKLAHLCSKESLILKGPFIKLPLLPSSLISFVNADTRDK